MPASAALLGTGLTVFGTRYFDDKREQMRWRREQRATRTNSQLEREQSQNRKVDEKRAVLTVEATSVVQFFAWMRHAITVVSAPNTSSEARLEAWADSKQQFATASVSIARLLVLAPGSELATEAQQMFACAQQLADSVQANIHNGGLPPSVEAEGFSQTGSALLQRIGQLVDRAVSD